MNKSTVTLALGLWVPVYKSQKAPQAIWACHTLPCSLVLSHEGFHTSYLPHLSPGLAHSGCSLSPVLACSKCSASIGLAHIVKSLSTELGTHWALSL